MDERLSFRDSHKLRLGTRELDEKILEASKRLDETQVSGTPDEVEALALSVETLRQERELFVWQHDVTGALKGDRIGADIREQFESMGFDRNRGEEVSGFREGGERTHLIVVNMGELDRLNESGDHALGDKALEITFARIQENVREHLLMSDPELSKDEAKLEGMYSIYRTGGADFSITLKNASPAIAAAIEATIVSTPLDVAKVHPGEESTYLTASTVSFAEAGEILKRLRGNDGDEDVDATLFVTALKEKAGTLSDFERTRARLGRVIEKMKQDSEGARTIYTKYHQNALGPLFAKPGEPSLEYEAFAKAVVDMGAEQDSEEWRRAAFDISRTDALQKLQQRNTQNRRLAKGVLELTLARLNTIAPEGAAVEFDEFPESSARRVTREFISEDVELFEKRAEFLGETSGESKIMELEEALETARAAGGSNAELKVKRAELELEIESTKRDQLTGLASRGIFFQNLERRLEKGEPVSVVSVDMAFLKYFDKEGGKHTGDVAIKTAGRILDYVAREIREKHQVEIEACRVGGDEFSFSVGSADLKVLEDIKNHIRIARVDTGPIPAMDGALQSYAPELLQFNVGIQSAESPKALKALIENMGVELPEGIDIPPESRRLADHLNHIADSQIGQTKAISRLAFLLTRALEQVEAAVDSKAEKQRTFTTLMAYSEKAVFGDVGKKKMSQWLPRLIAKETTVGALIRSEIRPFVQEQFRQKGVENLHLTEEMEDMLEYEIRLSLSEQRISELESSLVKKTEALGHEHEVVAGLKKELETMRQEREDVVNLRKEIKEAA